MLPTDLALARVCEEAYANTGKWDHAWAFDGTTVFHRVSAGVDVIVFRGTCTPEDWIRDAEAFPVWDARLGFVHGGFLCGMSAALEAIAVLGSSCLVLTGHSLGGARARILAALLAIAGKPAVRCTVFGSPRPGFANLARVLQKSGTPLASYRNRNDPVPLVPYLGGLYVHPDAWTAVDSAPGAQDLDPLRDHSIALYIASLTAAAAPTAAPAALQA